MPQKLPDTQSDLFALGVTLCQLLTGRLPFGEKCPNRQAVTNATLWPPATTTPRSPSWPDHVQMNAVAHDKRQPFETADGLRQALERGASRPPTAPSSAPLRQRDPYRTV
jgi:serine/threonine protein kinase